MIDAIEKEIIDQVKNAIKKAYNVVYHSDIFLEKPPQEILGDFSISCFHLAKVLKKAPSAIAQTLLGQFGETIFIDKVTAVGPYLNFIIKKEALLRLVITSILEAPDSFGEHNIGKQERILLEYSAPNTNKPQHLGHIRNNLLGMAVSNLLEAIGYEVIRVNLVNDRGVHICKSMLAYQKLGNGKTPTNTGIKGDHFVGQYYVLYEKEQKKEWDAWIEGKGIIFPKLSDQEKRKLEADFLSQSNWYRQVREMLQKWEMGDPEIIRLWETMNGWVYKGFEDTYRRLGCYFDKVYKESETYKLGKTLVLEGLNKGVFVKKEDGSVWLDLTDQGLDDKLLLRQDGTSVYITQDLGTTKQKFEDFKMHRAIWVVADEQLYHFRVLFAALKKLDYDWANSCYHLAYGMIDLPEGKMKSREGTIVDADDLMQELFELEKEEICKRDLAVRAEEIDNTAEMLAQGALKFFILKFLPQTRMLFNPQESISFDGFTGPYLQYAFVRIRSIFRKSGKDDYELTDSKGCDFSVLNQPEEAAIARELYEFPIEVQKSALEYNPARLCSYLFYLAKSFNTFYHVHPVLQAETKSRRVARLALCKATSIVLRRGLALLGIAVPERM